MRASRNRGQGMLMLACLLAGCGKTGADERATPAAPVADRPAPPEPADPIPEYAEIKTALARGWNTWHTRSVLTHALLPQGFALNLAFRQTYWLGGSYLREALIGRGGRDDERIRPGLHAYDGSYTDLEITWEQVNVRVQTAHAGEDLVILVTPLAKPKQPVHLVVESALLWNRPGGLVRDGDLITATLPGKTVTVHATAAHDGDPYHQTFTPYLSIPLAGPTGISTGTARTLDEIKSAIAAGEQQLREQAKTHGPLAGAYLAVQAGIAWNTVYEPMHERVISTVGRLWNEDRGGFCLFGWDNFFLAYMTGLQSRELAMANVIEHLRGKTDEGFIPNDNQANGRKSWDRSQPPVGSIMVREIYRRYPEKWFLAATFDDLLGWNRWWAKRRMNDGLLSYGSHEARNPHGEPRVRTMVTARYESGMDDSPMYEDVPFNPETGMMELQDVGLTSLYIADCEALAELAEIVGRSGEAKELRDRAQTLREQMERLWDERTGLYLNRRTDTGKLSRRLSPTLFYPLLARVPDDARARRIVDEHLRNPAEFWGEWVLPSTARNDRSFSRQRYWKGAIWPPLNFLTYLSLRNYRGVEGVADVHGELSEKSLKMFLREWKRKGYVSENYSAIDGTGDNPDLSSDSFHSWGSLFGIMAFIESEALAAPENPLPRG